MSDRSFNENIFQVAICPFLNYYQITKRLYPNTAKGLTLKFENYYCTRKSENIKILFII